jgi:hypothetical protein
LISLLKRAGLTNFFRVDVEAINKHVKKSLSLILNKIKHPKIEEVLKLLNFNNEDNSKFNKRDQQDINYQG